MGQVKTHPGFAGDNFRILLKPQTTYNNESCTYAADFYLCDKNCFEDGDGVSGMPDLLFFLSSFGLNCPK